MDSLFMLSNCFLFFISSVINRIDQRFPSPRGVELARVTNSAISLSSYFLGCPDLLASRGALLIPPFTYRFLTLSKVFLSTHSFSAISSFLFPALKSRNNLARFTSLAARLPYFTISFSLWIDLLSSSISILLIDKVYEIH